MKLIEFLAIIASVNLLAKSENISSIFEGCEKFHTEYYKELISSKTDDKTAVGILPLYSLLALLRHGTEDVAENIISNQVGLPHDKDQTAKQMEEVLKELVVDEQLQMSNAVFIHCDLDYTSPFIKTALISYKTALANINLTDVDEAVQFINDVHTTRTEGNVDETIDGSDISNDTKVIFGSASYYQLYFRYAFNRKNTKKKRFYENKHRSTVLNFMELKGMKLNYTKSDPQLISSVLELPLANPSLVAVFILPILRSLGVEHTDGIISSNPEIITRVIYNLEEQKLAISIPKFKIEYGNSKLISKEYASNYTFIQNNPGDFKLLLNFKTVILANDEDGVQEAQETEDELLHRFRLNRPFIFLIYNKQHNFTMFRGTFYSPYSKIYREECDHL